MINPISIFVNTLKAAKFWFTLFLLMLIANITQPFLIIEAMKQRDNIVIMDSAGVFHRAPVLRKHEATDMYEELTYLALDALFDKNPNGYDRQKLQEQLFLGSAMKTIAKIREKEDPHFINYKIHQKWELAGMKIKHPTSDTTHVLVSGQLIRNGNINKSEYFNEALDFKVLFTFAQNPDMSKNKRLPFIS